MGPSVRERWRSIVCFSNGLTHKLILPFVRYGCETWFLTPREVHNVDIWKEHEMDKKTDQNPEVNVEFGILQDREHCDITGYIVLLG